jgi:ABC-2 type transport system permease protein
VPDDYVKTQLDILTLIKEIGNRGKGKVQTRIHRIEPFTQDAMLADQRFGIVPRTVYHVKRGVPQPERIYLGVTLTSGLNTVRLPFIDRGQSVEYELVRAVCNVTAQEKKKIGILKTDAQVMGEFDFRTMRPPMPWPIIADFEQQYVVTEVDPQTPITEKFDVVLAVQPSSLAPNDMMNFIDMVRRGQPTLIFEDPLPFLFPPMPGTEDPKLPAGSSPMNMYARPLPKGNIEPLWEMLGVSFNTRRVPRSDYNPIRGVASGLPQEFLFLAYDPNKPEDRKNRPFSLKDPVTQMLRHVLMPFTGSINNLKNPKFEVKPLIWTMRANAYVERVDIFPVGRIGFGSRNMSPAENRPVHLEASQYDLAVRITGELPPVVQQTPDGDQPTAAASTKINVILVADVDMATPVFYALRQQGSDPRLGTNFTFDNMTFIMNAIDSLAGDERFLSVRGRRPEHRALDKFEEMTRAIEENVAAQRDLARTKFKETIEAAQKEMRDNIDKLAEALQADSQRLTMPELLSRVKAMEMAAQKKLEAQTEELQRELTQKETALEVQRQEDLRYQQGMIKALAIMIPPTPLLILASGVFFWRGMRETAGTSKKRLRSGKRSY